MSIRNAFNHLPCTQIVKILPLITAFVPLFFFFKSSANSYPGSSSASPCILRQRIHGLYFLSIQQFYPWRKIPDLNISENEEAKTHFEDVLFWRVS